MRQPNVFTKKKISVIISVDLWLKRKSEHIPSSLRRGASIVTKIIKKYIMRLQQNPLFRKEIAPWYDSDTSCFIMIGFLLVIFLFSITGIFEAYEKIEHHKHVWVPGSLAILSGVTIVSMSIRLIKRYRKQQDKERDDL